MSKHLCRVSNVVRIGLMYSLIAACFSIPAGATSYTIYTYTGNSFSGFDGIVQCPPVCSASGSFIMGSDLPANLPLSSATSPLWYSFSNGDTVFTGDPTDNTFVQLFQVGTNPTGQITEWAMTLFDPSSLTYLETVNNPSGSFSNLIPSPGSVLANLTGYSGTPITVYDFTFTYNIFSAPIGMAINTYNPGTWTVAQTDILPEVPHPVLPEPSAFILVASGLAGIIAMGTVNKQRLRKRTVKPS
jgi:hypothetical protein